MFARLLLLFTLVPFLELFLLIGMSRRVGPLLTFAIVLLTGLLGAYLARREGLRAIARLQTDAAAGRPVRAAVDGVLVLAAGLVLLTPGLMTDAVGFALMVPSIRARVGDLAIAAGRSRVTAKFATFAGSSGGGFGGRDRRPTGSDDGVIDVEFREVPPERPNRGGASIDA